MGNPGFRNIKSLSKKLAASLIKNQMASDFEKSDMFDETTKSKMLVDIKERERLELLKQIDVEKDWKILKKKLKSSKGGFKSWYYGIAAVAVLLISLTFMLKKNTQFQDVELTTPIIVNSNISVGTDKATLTLENGTNVVLEKGQVYQSNNVSSNGEEIVYQPTNTSITNAPIAHNTLTIPRGGRFFIELSDGTKVWLNSETQLKYPVAFTKGETREVELVYGEAYFDVASSTLHDGAKFKVHHQFQDVEVLGTEFNVKAYKDETIISTTLVEGKVAIGMNHAHRILMPNQQFNLSMLSGDTEILTVEVDGIVSWKDGVFDFEGKTLKEIMRVLSRWYDIDVVFLNKSMEREKFIGTFNKNLSIEDVLLTLKVANIINNYKIKGKVISIK